MVKQIRELDEIVASLDGIISVLYMVQNCHFGNTDPDLARLKVGYIHCANTFDMIYDELIRQRSNLDNISNEFHELNRKISDFFGE